MAKNETIERVDPSDIEVNPALRVRKGGVDMEHVQRLCESIGQFGQRQPIILRKGSEKGKYILEAGEHRLEAIKLHNSMQGEGESPMLIKAVVVDHDDTNGLIGAVIENALRKETNVFDQGDSMAKLAKGGKKNVELAQIFGVSEATVSQRLALAEAPKKLVKMVESGDMEADAAIFISKLPVDDKIREAVIEECLRHRNTMEEMEKAYDAKREEREAKQEAVAAAKQLEDEIKALQTEYKAACKEAKEQGVEQPKPPKALTEALKKKDLSSSQKQAFASVKKSAGSDKKKRKATVEDAKRAAKAKGAVKEDTTPTPLSRKQFVVILEALGTDEKNPLPQSARDLMGRIEARLDDEISDTQLRNAFVKFCVPD